MLPPDLNIPSLSEPFATALSACLEHVFAAYDVVGLLATGTIVRGTGDARSDLDIHVLHSGEFRERVQLWFNGVPCEIFVNPPDRIQAYFDEDVRDRRPIAPHMFATGVVAYDPLGVVAPLVESARAILENSPLGPSEFASVQLRYSAATEFEDVDDLAERDPAAAALLLGGAVRKLAECRVALAPGWLPRAKDLLNRLREIDHVSAELAVAASSDMPFNDRLEAARKLCRRITDHDGFFEWTSPRENIVHSPPAS